MRKAKFPLVSLNDVAANLSGWGGDREGDMAVGVWKIMSQGGKINGD